MDYKDITKYILNHDWSKLLDIKNYFSGTNDMRTLPSNFYKRDDETITEICHGYKSDVKIEFYNQSKYSSESNQILNYHYIPNNNEHGVVAYKQPLKNFCCNSFVSSGQLSGCIVCFLIFKEYILFIHEGGNGASINQQNSDIVSRCHQIWRAICIELNHSHYSDDTNADVITGENAIDWLIQRIESIKELLFGSIMYSSSINCGINGISKSKRVTFLNYNYHTEIINLQSQMLCIAHRHYIGLCSMYWDQNDVSSHGIVIETAYITSNNMENQEVCIY